MGCCSSAPADAVPTEQLRTVPLMAAMKNPETARVIIVGGGVSGIHMASELKKRNFKNVIILEKEQQVAGRYGKTWTHLAPETGDTPHEMGTCYLSWSYKNVRKLIKEYLGDGALIEPGGEKYGGLTIVSPETGKNHNVSPVMVSDDFLFAHAEEVNLPNLRKVWPWIPDKVQVLDIMRDIHNYRKLHESIFGVYEYHGLPPKPGPKSQKLLNITFRDLMMQNNMKPILDMLVMGFGSYGFSYGVPALYGLWFATPPALESYIQAKFDSNIKKVELLKNGYGSLWKAIVEKHSLDIRYGSNVESVDRNLTDRSKPVVVKVNGENLECDLLIWAAPMWSQFLPIVKDATPFEKEVVRSLKSVGLMVNLLETAKKPSQATPHGERSLTFYSDSLMPLRTPDPGAAKAVYAERNSVRAFRPELEESTEKRYDVVYQYLPAYEPNAELATQKALEFISSTELAVEPTPTDPPPKRLLTANYDYFPHFTQEGVNALLPWKVFEHQGKERTWYIGNSVCFESAEDVTRYNDQLLAHKFQSA